ncbi:MAG: helix-turn-helix domain-containing protein [Alphaproteobacteria bacterium]|nr:helix-turn-helix domain-containing protein [Alphaproteobacteria bacterium]
MKNKTITPTLLSTEDAAIYLGISARTLETWRCKQRYDIPYVRIGSVVRYKISDLDDYISKNTIIAS